MKMKTIRQASAPRLIKVNASAGSGKTWWLVSRFFALLRNVAPQGSASLSPCLQNADGSETLDHILGITFTNAAAAEMRGRIIERLKKAALGEDEDSELPNGEQAQAWLESILADYSSLNFRTIDSLLHLLTRSSALELGLNPDFDTAFDLSDIFSPWFGEIFEAAETDIALRRQLADVYRLILEDGSFKGFLSGGKLQKQILKMLGPVLLGKFEGAATVEELNALRPGLEAKARDVQPLSRKLLDLVEEENIKLHNKAQEALQKLADGDLDASSEYFYKTDFSQLCRAKTVIPPSVPPVFEAWSRVVKEYCGSARSILAMLDKAEILLALIGLAQILARRFDKDKATAKLLPQLLMPSFATLIMHEGAGVSDAICKLGVRLSHFLIDEFQDTGDDQWNAVKELAREALAAGGSLSTVGDGKQSIYSWRGGDPDIFANLLEDTELTQLVEKKGIELLNLPSNRRSLPAIVDHNNKFFSILGKRETAEKALTYLLPKKTDLVPAEMVKSFKMELCEKLAKIYETVSQKPVKVSEGPGKVEFMEIRAKTAADIWEKSIDAVCRLIKDKLCPDRPYSDILILCRRNEDCLDIARELIRLNVPVITENSLLLSEHPLIVQTLALLRFLYNRDDAISFWTLVTGSILSGHPEWQPHDDLNNWLGERRRGSLSAGFAESFPDLWEKFFRSFLNSDAILSAYDVVREWLTYLDVEKRFPKDGTFIRRFLEILHKAEINGAMSVADFLDFWDESGGEEKTPMPENANAVRIMTIHKAKGLQNRVVIVPQTNFSRKSSREIGLIEMEGLKIPVSLGNQMAGRQYLEKYGSQALETLNILYVAFTRAEEELYYFVNFKESKNADREKPKKNSKPATPPTLMHFLLENAECNPAALVLPEARKGGETSGKELTETIEIAPLSGKWQPLGWMPRLKIYRAHPTEENLTAVERGNFAHRCLERLNPARGAKKAAETAFNATLREAPYSIPENERPGLLQSLQWFAGLPFARHWLEKGWREQTIVAEEGDLLRPDLLVPDGEGALVVDYKTGESDTQHIAQVRKYLLNLGKTGAFSGKLRGCLVYLDKHAFIGVSPGSHTSLTTDAAAAGIF